MTQDWSAWRTFCAYVRQCTSFDWYDWWAAWPFRLVTRKVLPRSVAGLNNQGLILYVQFSQLTLHELRRNTSVFEWSQLVAALLQLRTNCASRTLPASRSIWAMCWRPRLQLRPSAASSACVIMRSWSKLWRWDILCFASHCIDDRIA